MSAWTSVLLWMALLFALSAIPGTAYPRLGFRATDKVVHLVVYAPLGALIARATTRSTLLGRGTVWGVAVGIGTAFGVSDEIHQAFVPFRSPDLGDVIADLLGAAAGAALWLRARWHLARATHAIDREAPKE